jgi:hypothetical protein
MPSQKPSPRKKLNKQLKRTFDPLKCRNRKFAKLPGVNLALFIEIERRDRNNEIKKEFYSLRSKRDLSFLRNIDAMVSIEPIAFFVSLILAVIE